MVLSTTTRRLQLQPSNMRMLFAIPMENLDDYVLGRCTSLVFDLNAICTLVNFAVQHIVIVLTIDRLIGEYHGDLNWVTFAAAMVSCIGTITSLIVKRRRPPHKGRWFNFFVSSMLVASSGYALAVQGDPRPVASLISGLLLCVTKANSQTKKKWFLLGDKRVPIAGFRIRDGVIFAVIVNAEHAHLFGSVYQGGWNVALSVSSGERVRTNLNMREE